MSDAKALFLTVSADALVKRLRRMGDYTIKHSSVGWWVDGYCGYSVAGYYDSKKEAVVNAIINIKQSQKQKQEC